jgi:branched-chain amino acid transport system substrate-binding protein
LHRPQRNFGTRRLFAAGVLALLAVAGCTNGSTSTPATGGTIKIGILSDCLGDFGSFYNDDLGGALAVLAAHYGGHASGALPKDGMTGAKIAGKDIQVSFGCSDSTANKALEETRRLVEQWGADIMIGPLSGDEGIAVATYAKSQPNKTFLNGISGAQDTTLKVQAPNFFRFNPDGAQWSSGLGDYAYNKLGWRSAAVIGDDYAFPYTSLAGFIAEFCSIGGNVPSENRIWPPLGTTDYSSWVAKIPKNVDGLFVGVGGAGLITFLKEYQNQRGALNTQHIMGNTFWPDPQLLHAIGTPMVGAVAASGIAGDATFAQTAAYKQELAIYPATQKDAASVFTLGYWSAMTALGQALTAVNGDLSNGQKALLTALATTVVQGPYGKITLDSNRQAVFDNWIVQITAPPSGSSDPGIHTILRVPKVDQTFGGFFSPSTPAPSRTDPTCTKKTPPPWVGNETPVDFSAGNVPY